jgi:pimeloyl-ACP methyl ester carboxylesterase
MFPGFNSRRCNSTNTALARRLIERGVRCVVADLSGHGESQGSIREQTIVKAAHEIVDVLDHVRKYYTSGSRARLGVLGNSFSGNAAILAAARTPDLAALALKSPVTEYTVMRTSQLGRFRMQLWRRQGWIRLPDGTISDYGFIEAAESVDTYAELARVRAPVLAIQGSRDEEIPRESRRNFEAVMKRLGMTYRLIEGGNHNLSDPHFKDMVKAFEDFLIKNLLHRTPVRS